MYGRKRTKLFDDSFALVKGTEINKNIEDNSAFIWI